MSRVVAWWPVPNPIDGWITTEKGAIPLFAGTSQGGATVIRPTVTALNAACDRAAQSSSSTSVDSTNRWVPKAAPSARAAWSRASAVEKNARRHWLSLAELSSLSVGS